MRLVESMIKLITFDLDNTLWDVGPVLRRADSDLKRWMNESHPEVLMYYKPDTFAFVKNKLSSEHPHKLNLPTFVRMQFLLHCYSLIGLKGVNLERHARNAFDVFHHARNQIDFYPETIPMLNELSKSFALIALSNGNADVEKVGLGNYFVAQYSADSTGKPKPHPAMFKEALDFVGVAATESIHVGDHQVEDVKAAQALGFRTVWLNDKRASRSCSPDAEVSDLKRMLSSIRQLVALHRVRV